MSQPFTNENIDLERLPAFESISFAKPHPAYWKVIAISLLLWLLILGASITILCLLDPQIFAQISYIASAYVVLAIALFLIYRASFKKRGYALREKDLIYKSGLIAETTTIVPLNRIQHVALNEGLISRMFKLGKLQVYTAGGQSGHLGIAGIEIEKAKQIKEILLKKLDQIENETIA
ncbi:MAG: PH domain-containing protein [Pedobacter sp.]|nr:PH domain-containing protein [Pedobacter sp.]MDQ8053679.1 PH domain-containing protein [Pedobacter sp.]